MSRPRILNLSKGRYFVSGDHAGVLTDNSGVRTFGPHEIIRVEGEVRYFSKAAPIPGKQGYPKERKEYADTSEAKFPVDDEKHVRAAIAYFHKHRFPSEDIKKKTARRILEAAKKHGISVSPDSDVARAAK